MGVLWDSLQSDVRAIFGSQWTVRDSTIVPEPEDLKLGSNDGVRLDAAILYADLAESTNLVDNFTPEFAAEIYKAYLHCAAKAIKSTGGEIVSYDGDRIMAVYVGDSKNTSAAKAALKINGAVVKLINPAIKEVYKNSSFQVTQAVGVDTSPILAARTGVRGENDIVWVGRAANYAAKLCGFRSSGYASILTSDVYNMLHESARLDESTGRNMWTLLGSSFKGCDLYGSTWYTFNY